MMVVWSRRFHLERGKCLLANKIENEKWCQADENYEMVGSFLPFVPDLSMRVRGRPSLKTRLLVRFQGSGSLNTLNTDPRILGK